MEQLEIKTCRTSDKLKKNQNNILKRYEMVELKRERAQYMMIVFDCVRFFVCVCLLFRLICSCFALKMFRFSLI